MQKFSLTDYPNLFSCVVLTNGCNWRCPWCSAGDFVFPEKIAARAEISQKQVINFLKQQKGKLQAVVLSGGEPTIHKDLPALCRAIKKQKYKIKLDTNGSNPAMLICLIHKGLVDYVALDIKAPKEKYPQIIGAKGSSANYLVDNVQKSIDLLKKNKVDYEFKTTFSPQLTREDILEIAHWIRPAKKYRLQLLRKPDKEHTNTKEHKTLFSIQHALAPFFDECDIT